MAEDPEAIRKEADEVLKREFSIDPPTARLLLHDTASWGKLKRQRNSKDDPGSTLLGLYFQTEKEAHVWMGSSQWVSTLYHELHGHGLYYEHSLLGNNRAYRDHVNRTVGPAAWGILQKPERNSEGFATWMEQHLCLATGRDRLWRQVRAGMPRRYRDAYESASALARELSDVGFMRQMGFPIAIGTDGAASILRTASGNKRIELAALVTARPYDPVRVLIVSDDRPTIREWPWLKPRVIDGERFVKEVVERDETLASQLKDAQLLCGDAWAFEKAKERLVNGPDTHLSSGPRSRNAYAPWP